MLDVYKHVTQTPHIPLVIHLHAKGDEPRFFRGFSEAVAMTKVPRAETTQAVKVSRAVKKAAGAGAGIVAKKAGAEKAPTLPSSLADLTKMTAASTAVTDDSVSNMTSNAVSVPNRHQRAEAVTKDEQIVE
jgi:hypothetical protein